MDTRKYLFDSDDLGCVVKTIMEKKGYERCKSIFPFTRFFNECRVIGMDEWMKEHLQVIDYKAYKHGDAFPD